MATVAAPTRGHKKRERTRRQLIGAAIDTIAERGEAFSVSHVTDRAGVSNGTFYNYFDDRDALIDALVPEVMGVFAAESADAVDATDPAVRFATITALALRRAAHAPDRLRAILRLDAVQQAILDGEALGHLRADIAAGAATGRFSALPDQATIDVVVGGILLAARRIAGQSVDAGYVGDVVGRLLVTLGVRADEAVDLGRAAAQVGVSPATT